MFVRFVLTFLVGCATTTLPDDDVGTEPETPSSLSIDGAITWNVDFSDEGEQAGKRDCAYTRTYSGVEDRSAPWLCPDCDVVFRVDAEVTAGLDDCYAQISNGTPASVEWLGWTVEGEFRRGGRVNYRLSEQGAVTLDGESVSTSNELEDLQSPDGQVFGFVIAGAFTLGASQSDPMHGWETPETYACGWGASDAPVYDGDYRLRVGKTMPDGLLLDQCEEPVRLHDFKGKYLVIDISAVDCPPCRNMARQEPAFVADMEASGHPTEVITLLAPSLSAVLDPATPEVIDKWVSDFGLHGPVLADRGWGYWLGNEALPTGFAYPTWILVSPELEVLDMGAGFGGFDRHKAAILAHAGS